MSGCKEGCLLREAAHLAHAPTSDVSGASLSIETPAREAARQLARQPVRLLVSISPHTSPYLPPYLARSPPYLAMLCQASKAGHVLVVDMLLRAGAEVAAAGP